MANLKKIELKLKTDEELKPIFAAYFNLARANVFNTLINISKCAGFELRDNDKEESMADMAILSNKLRADKANSIRRLLYLHFPFLKIASVFGNNSLYESEDEPVKEEITTNIKDLQAAIKNIVSVLNYYRNKYSHYHIYQPYNGNYENKERQVAEYLKNIIIAAPRAVKARFKGDKNRQQENMLPDGTMDFIHNNKMLPSSNNGKKQSKWNKEYFLYPLKGEKLSTVGLIVFCSLFLEKKYINELLKQSGFLSTFSSEKKNAVQLSEQSIILELLSIYRIRLPQRKINVEMGKVHIALDMLNELKKCPEELFKLLSDKDKEAFAITSDNNERVLQRRKSDRFPQLILSYFDNTKAFNNLRFLINGGKFRYLFNENKRCIDGGDRIRVLQDDLNCFYRLNEFEEKRMLARKASGAPTKPSGIIWREYDIKNFDKAPKDEAKSLPYIADIQSHYVFNGDNVGIRYKVHSNEVNYIPSIVKGEDNHYRVANIQPDCWMSKYELPAMAFHYYLYQHSSDKENFANTESIIHKYIINYRKFFDDIAIGKLSSSCKDVKKYISDNYQINWNDIPDKIKGYLLKKEYNSEERVKNYKLRIVNTKLQETQERLTWLKSDKEQITGEDENGKKSKGRKNKIGEKDYARILPGRLATFLARDILYFQEYKKAEDKLTGLNYNVLQAVLATFSPRNVFRNDDDNKNDKSIRVSNIVELRKVLGKDGAKLFNSHPFLNNVCNGTKFNVFDTVSFYEAYLKERLVFLKKILKELNDNKVCNYSFFHTGKAKWQTRNEQYYKNLAKRYIQDEKGNNASIFLPRQLFDQEIIKQLGQYPELKETLNERVNVTYLIAQFFKKVLDDSVPVFYGETKDKFEHKHNYNFFKNVNDNPKDVNILLNDSRIKKDGVFYNELLAAKEWSNNNKDNSKKQNLSKNSIEEKELRNSFRFYTENEKILRRYKVQDILLFLLAKEIIMESVGITDRGKNGFKLRDITPKGGSILDTKMDITTKFTFDNIDKRIAQKNVPIKDYGEIYKLLYDTRVLSLVKELRDDIIDAESMKNEIGRYNNSRVLVFKDILKYENSIYHANETELKQKTKLQFLDILEKDFKLESIDKECLRIIRNSFAHNHYPPVSVKDTKNNKSKELYKRMLPKESDKEKGPAMEIKKHIADLTHKE